MDEKRLTYWTSSRRLLAMAMIAMGLAVPAVLSWQSDRDTATPAAAAERKNDFNLTNLQVPAERLLSGGPPKDGIPALVDPQVVKAVDADFLRPDDRVVGVVIDDQARAYPLNVLNWHEVINDRLGGVPIAVIYCPLCDSVSVVDRRLGDRTYTFGISGLLLNSNVLFYDRIDQALWSQVGLRAISGPNAAKSLKHLPWELTTFKDWSVKHSESTVVSFNTGHERDYARNPYADYFATDELMFPVEPLDNRLPKKERVIGVAVGKTAKAYPLRSIQQAAGGTIRDVVAGKSVVLKLEPSGAVKVVEAPAETKVVHTFWFAWAAFHPETDVFATDD